MARHSITRRRLNLSALGLAALLALPLGAQAADTWPSRPITMVVPFPPGSSPDTLGRMVAEPLAQKLGQPIVVENKPGAGGNIGTRLVAQAKPDGYTILLTINGPIVTAPALYKSTLGYDPECDLQVVSMIGTSPNVLVVPADAPADNVQQFVERAKERPGELNYGTVGPGSSSHLGMAMLEQEAGISLLQIPYTGFPQVITSIVAGDVHAGFMVPGVAMPQVNAGKVKVLGITSLEESDVLPGLPTVASQGYPGFESISWDALFVPAGTPPEIVEKLNKNVLEVLAMPEVQEKMATLYFTAAPTTPAEAEEMIQAEKKKLTALIEKLGITLD
ncbi:Bug family tripartite tricarboxylate transporter substrate binding protein [Yanghanlia caeni]|uniref:Tripartite tricarboxylate transporter substrate binding protein n=1 Tax=Yanghanlia caeni TaxID=3064283 RepID=A0ABU1D7N0_9BURK|nr:tripartite tricarboxylate transporter substrate binding protein [Alcaligenaceae bacterium LG-2]